MNLINRNEFSLDMVVSIEKRNKTETCVSRADFEHLERLCDAWPGSLNSVRPLSGLTSSRKILRKSFRTHTRRAKVHSMGRKLKYLMWRSFSPCAVRSRTDLTTPSLPGYVCMIRPTNHFKGGRFESLMRTSDPMSTFFSSRKSWGRICLSWR